MTDYHDIDGNPITLPKLCRTEPEWAANRIRDLSAERDTAEANLERLQNKFEQVTGEDGRLSAEVQNRDRDWILAIGHALGLDSGFDVPIVPEVEPFKRLFKSVRDSGKQPPACKHGAYIDCCPVCADGNSPER